MPDPVPMEMQLEDTTEGTILMRVQDRIRALELPGIHPDKVVIRKLPWVLDNDQLPPPYIIISPAPESINWASGTNETDTTIFGVMVSLVLADKRDVSTHGMGVQLFWLERLRRKFQNKSLGSWSDLVLPSGVFFVHCFVESGDKFMELAKREQRDANYYLIRIAVKEPRE